MTLFENRAVDLFARWALVLLGSFFLIVITLALGRFVDSSWDMSLLLLLNPDGYIPLVDEFMIFLTDFSVYVWALLAVSWLVGYYICRENEQRKARANHVYRTLGLLAGLYHGSAAFYHNPKFYWWSEYEFNLILIPLGLLFVACGWLAGLSFVALDDKQLRKLSTVFWLTLLTTTLTNFIGTNYIKETVGRHRPLHAAYAPWNEQLRTIADEIVRGGHSYVSGHSSSLFALLTPLFWALTNRYIRAGLLVWAALHAFTRVYVAVHFPYCCLMGSLLGFAIGTLVFHLLWPYEDRL